MINEAPPQLSSGLLKFKIKPTQENIVAPKQIKTISKPKILKSILINLINIIIPQQDNTEKLCYIFLYMRLHRFYVTNPINTGTFDITDKELVHQWKSVFRYNVASQVILFDGSGPDYLCMITSLRNLGATVSVVEAIEEMEKPKVDLWLCLGLIKKDNFELVVQKATELGVTHIVPVLCERSEKKNLNMERIHKIVVEASEQSGRGTIPNIHDIRELPDLLKEGILPKDKLALNLEGDYIQDVVTEKNYKELAIFIGPEGGWGDRELKEFEKNAISSVSLGAQVLRAETAAIAASSLLLL